MRRLGERRLQGGGTATYARGPRLRSMCETDGFMLRQVQCWGFDVGTPPENQPVGTLKIHLLEKQTRLQTTNFWGSVLVFRGCFMFTVCCVVLDDLKLLTLLSCRYQKQEMKQLHVFFYI